MGFLILFLVIFPLVIIVQCYVMVLKMSEPEKMLKPIPGGLSEYQRMVLADNYDWLASQGFIFLRSFQFGLIQVAVFKQENTQRFFAFQFHQKLTYDITTAFDDVSSLTTASGNAIGMFPIRPGVYKQGFPGITVQDALRRHIEAEEYLTQKFGIVTKPLTRPFLEGLLNSMRLEMKHVRSIPLWPVRCVYWYFVKRGQMANKSIQMQYP